MNYKLLYLKLTERGKPRIRANYDYLEKHHIIPKCVGGIDSKENITLLTAREHFIAHWMLCKIYNQDKNSQYKLSSAFNMMCRHNVQLGNSKRTISSRLYSVARQNFAKNHPMKNPITRNKAKESHAKRSAIIKKINEENLPLCKCGCGIHVRNKRSGYLLEHFPTEIIRRNAHTDVANKKRSNSVKLFIEKLTYNEKEKRLENSLHNSTIDHIKRGQHISLAKRGVTTNQQAITGKRYASLTDIEFQKYLENISVRMKQRAVNLRRKYI
jgi:hypothetical protein